MTFLVVLGCVAVVLYFAPSFYSIVGCVVVAFVFAVVAKVRGGE